MSDDSISRTLLSLFEAHGVIMWTAMGFLVPCGILARRLKSVMPHRWFAWHSTLQSLAVALMIAGFTMAVTFTCLDGMPHFSIPHKKVGLLLFVLVVLQRINGEARPHAAEPNSIKAHSRTIWEFLHKGLGYIIWIIGQYVLFSGLQLVDSTVALVQIGWSMLQIVLFLLVFMIVRFRERREAGMTAKLKSKPQTSYHT
eukprot:CAMPEP_0197038118 /NCGR_PEP_ID=MMETSP1384-20130603/15132_1 /TAXON_ID=29189 /ORGANISM="Ammonia sp." /LENGTH=198 /DNA_ID=CAMNT_0042468511 /DNA_START=18 /DNA_END=614 /DNA_ORIENTATION=+